MTHGWRVAPALWLLLLVPVAARAQQVSVELRVDGAMAREDALHAGGGVGVRLARSVAVAMLASGALAHDEGAPTARIEMLGRFLFDPERRSRHPVYASGGVAALHADEGEWRGVLVAMLGVELGRESRWAAFLEAGYGGGLRAAAGLRLRPPLP